MHALTAAQGDPVAPAQREALERTLGEIAAAQHRLKAGRFGICTGCTAPIRFERLEARPWSATCIDCANR